MAAAAIDPLRPTGTPVTRGELEELRDDDASLVANLLGFVDPRPTTNEPSGAT
jgi:hypothetical protein